MPRPREIRHTARKWFSPQLDVPNEQKKLFFEDYRHSHPEKYKRHKWRDNEPKINHWVYTQIAFNTWFKTNNHQGDSLVARANQRFCAFLAIPSSSVCSDAATEPHGYSAPTPIPSSKLWQAWDDRDDSIAVKLLDTYRMTLSITSVPRTAPCAPSDAADRPEKRNTIPVAVI